MLITNSEYNVSLENYFWRYGGKKTKNWTSKGKNTISHSYPHNTALFVFHQNLEYNIVFQHN